MSQSRRALLTQAEIRNAVVAAAYRLGCSHEEIARVLGTDKLRVAQWLFAYRNPNYNYHRSKC